MLGIEHQFKTFFALDLSLHIFQTILPHCFVIVLNESKHNTCSFTLQPSCTNTLTNGVYFSVLPLRANRKYKS